MRLLHTTKLTFTDFYDSKVPKYCILSHRWGDDEVKYDAIISGDIDTSSKGFRKILGSCRLAQQRNYEYIWIDTCCINKSSSAELSEAINAMHSYYENADLCIVYLTDVTPTPPYRYKESLRKFRKSSWFTRGWTLQELLAPSRLEFYDCEFNLLGSKAELREEVSEITGIDTSYLSGRKPVNEASVATRMFWASSRETTRLEDEAYSLLGIFGVNMPLLYGEGSMAFFRLQREIISISNDESIFAWLPARLSSNNDELFGMIANSSRDFSQSRNVQNVRIQSRHRPPYSLTNRGLEFHGPWQKRPSTDDVSFSDDVLVGLSCKKTDQFNVRKNEVQMVAICLRKIQARWYRVSCRDFHLTSAMNQYYASIRGFFVSQPNLKTTPCLSKEEGLDYIASIRDRRADRDKWLGREIFKYGGIVLVAIACKSITDSHHSHRRKLQEFD